MKHQTLSLLLLAGAASTVTGCASRTTVVTQPAAMAPPVATSQPMNQPMGQPVANVYDWRSVPMGQRVPVERAAFDQGGYQIYTPDGTVVVPFANQNLYVMKFARSMDGQTYFENAGDAPIMYLSNGFGLANAAASGAMWYPLPATYQPTAPVYVGLAPTWAEFNAMGWYPGMTYYGGLYTPYYHPGMIFNTWTPGFVINIGSHPYYNYTTYTTYYHRTPGYVHTTLVSNVYSQPRATRYVLHNTGSGFNRSGGMGTGSFNRNRGMGSRTQPAFNGTGNSSLPPRSSFTPGSSGYRTTPRSGGSFGTGGSGGSFGRSSGGSFGRSSGGSFGRSSSGGRRR